MSNTNESGTGDPPGGGSRDLTALPPREEWMEVGLCGVILTSVLPFTVICIGNGTRLNTSILMLPAGMEMNISMKSSGLIHLRSVGDGALMRMQGHRVYHTRKRSQ